MSTLIDPVSLDLARHMAALDVDAARDDALTDLHERRYEVLTGTAEGFSDVLEATAGRLDKELFALFQAWSSHDPKAVERAVDALGHGWDTQADAMATEWAREEEEDRYRLRLITGGRDQDDDGDDSE